MMTNLVYYYPQGHEGHSEDGNPERPQRVEAMVQGLKSVGMWDQYPKIEPIKLSPDFLERVHSPEYLEWLPEFSARGQHLDGDTYTTPRSWQLALNTAGGATAIAQAVWNGENNSSEKLRGFALTRPPGHHAKRRIGMGFCLLNNIAIAAEYLLSSEFPGHTSADRLAIVDLDLHHGNGTQDIFWNRADVLYISAHQSPLYPGTGAIDEIGAGPGEGYTINLPFPPGTGDAGYTAGMIEIILPALDRFQPQALLISAGFDPHWRDPLGHLLLTADGYYRLIHQLVEWADNNCQGRILLIFEGGYDLSAISECAKGVVSALLGQLFHDNLGPPDRAEGSSWKNILKQARAIWTT